ncbi:MAG: hypothetical protein HY721_15175 [Planctomycetes bacterium]|nr:hypothetical protein [Planctomycetota bacterium]
MLRTLCSLVLLSLVLGPTGCGGPPARGDRTQALPFLVRLKPVQVRSDPAPPGFDDTETLTKDLAAALERSRIFTAVLADLPGDPDTEHLRRIPADLELEIEVTGESFGSGKPKILGALLSTLTWLLAGHLSWFIDNREYPDSSLAMSLSIRPAARSPERREGEAGEDFFPDELRLRGLALNFLERGDMKSWLYNIVVPPWWGEGSPEKAGASLAKRSVGYFEEREPDRILATFPLSYFKTTSRFLVNDPEKDRVIILSQEPVERIEIKAPRRKARALDADSVRALVITDEAEMNEARSKVSARAAGIATKGIGPAATDIYYPVELEDDEVGLVRVEAFSARTDAVPTRWTVYRPGPSPAPRVATTRS